MSQEYYKRRVLLRCNGEIYKLFKARQEKDGSIYLMFENFPNIKWLEAQPTESGLNVNVLNSTEEVGKLSVHASGKTGFRANDAPGYHQLFIEGHNLLNAENNTLGTRHLVSVFMERPQDILSSPSYGKRDSDAFLDKQGILNPFVMVLFAIPRSPDILSWEVGSSLDFDDADLSNTGFGSFTLRFHSIVWHIYGTKHMDMWPPNSYVCYHDGYHVPIYIGLPKKEGVGSRVFRLELRAPVYEIKDGTLRIEF